MRQLGHDHRIVHHGRKPDVALVGEIRANKAHVAHAIGFEKLGYFVQCGDVLGPIGDGNALGGVVVYLVAGTDQAELQVLVAARVD